MTPSRRSSLALLVPLFLLGRPIAGQQLTPVALERRLAAELELRVGDTVRLGAAPDSQRVRAVVAAIYEPVPDPTRLLRGERQIRLHLPDLAVLLGAPDRVDRFGVVLRVGVDPAAAAVELNRTAYGFRAIPSREVAGGASRTFVVVSRFHRAIAGISIVASAIFLLCIMLLKVEERRLDAAVLRAVGVSRRTIVGALLLEAGLLSLLGSALGTGMAYAGSTLTNAWYRHVFDTGLAFSWLTPGTVVVGIVLSLVLGVVAGGLASWRLVRTRPLLLWGRG